MKVEAEFETDLFSAEPGEDALINPGRFGRKLASHLYLGFLSRGFDAAEPIAEDWGWCVEIRGLTAPFMIGAGNVDEETQAFRVFIDPSTPVIKKLFKKIDISADLARVSHALSQILESEPGIRNLRWE